MIVMMIVFVLVTLMLGVATNSTIDSRRQVARTKALHMADAGLNAYLYELRRNPNFYVANPQLGPTAEEEGSWVVTATAPTQTTPLTLHARGTIPAYGMEEAITARVAFPTFADYMFLADDDLNVGAGATIEGKVRSNGNITNAGRITGVAEAVGTITGSGVFEKGKVPGSPQVDFAQVTADLADIRQAAQAAGTDYAASGVQGYYVVLEGGSARISKVTGGMANGNLTFQVPATVVTIPSSGVLYFNDRVWVSGEYSARVTIASSRDIYIPKDLVPSNPNSPQTCGLIASNNIIVPYWYPDAPTNMRITAALLAQNGAIYADLKNGVVANKVTITGSMSYRQYGYFAQQSGNTVVAGFRTRVYSYDPRLEVNPPPMYPQIKDGSLKISVWNED